MVMFGHGWKALLFIVKKDKIFNVVLNINMIYEAVVGRCG